MTINIARDFSPFPAGRVRSDGPDSGQRFREDFLAPVLLRGENLVVDIDGTEGYQTSFLEEAFGGLVRHGVVTKDELLARLTIVNNDENYRIYRELILQFIKVAQA